VGGITEAKQFKITGTVDDYIRAIKLKLKENG
jgi:hypothetical protein